MSGVGLQKKVEKGGFGGGFWEMRKNEKGEFKIRKENVENWRERIRKIFQWCSHNEKCPITW